MNNEFRRAARGGVEGKIERKREKGRCIYVEGLVVLVEGKGEVREVWGREAQQVPLNY